MDFYEETKVKFADLSEDMLWEYIDSGEPMWVGTFKLFFDSTAVVFFWCSIVLEPYGVLLPYIRIHHCYNLRTALRPAVHPHPPNTYYKKEQEQELCNDANYLQYLYTSNHVYQCINLNIA